MNKFYTMGRLTKAPEIRYAGGNNTCVAHFTLAVDRRYKREGEPEADFFNFTAFGKTAEFIEKWLDKGSKVVIEGRVENNNYKDKNGNMVYSQAFMVENIEVAEWAAKNKENATPSADSDDFMNIPDGIEDELPFH